MGQQHQHVAAKKFKVNLNHVHGAHTFPMTAFAERIDSSQRAGPVLLAVNHTTQTLQTTTVVPTWGRQLTNELVNVPAAVRLHFR